MNNNAHRWEDDLRLALVIADQVDQVTLSRFGARDLEVNTKADNTWVSDADKTAESIIRSQLSRSRSRDSILGEETGSSGHSSRQWVIDPIDGTSNYVRGVPVWATLIALIEDGEVVASTVSAPALNRRWWAAKGSGAWTGRSISVARRISVSKISQLSDASISYSSLGGWAKISRLRGFMNLLQGAWRTRAYGDFWSYMLLAEGCIDIACEPELALWDMAALVPIVTEAGGKFTSITGEAGPFGSNALATNTLLHEQALAFIKNPQDI